MNQKQKDKLMELFNEQQKLNQRLFVEELASSGNPMDYKEERMQLELSIYNSQKSIRELKDYRISLDAFIA